MQSVVISDFVSAMSVKAQTVSCGFCLLFCRYERTFWDALRCHVQYLYDLGLQGKVPHSD